MLFFSVGFLLSFSLKVSFLCHLRELSVPPLPLACSLGIYCKYTPTNPDFSKAAFDTVYSSLCFNIATACHNIKRN